MAPPNVEAPRAVFETVEAQRKIKANPNHKLCANCRQPIAGGAHHLLGVHASCWLAAGGHVRRVHRADIEREVRAEIARWRDEYVETELRLAAEGWLP